MKQKDTFTSVMPTYVHQADTCYKAPSNTHREHKEFQYEIDGTHVALKDLSKHKKVDFIKNFSETMYWLKEMKPPARKAEKNAAGNEFKVLKVRNPYFQEQLQLL